MANLKISEHFSKEEMYSLVKRILDGCKVKEWKGNDEWFNHNAHYRHAKVIMEHGVLPNEVLKKSDASKGEIQLTDDEKNDGYVSASKVEEYDPKKDFYFDHTYPRKINLVIDSSIADVKTIRSNGKRYSNAYLISGSIPLEYVKGIQVRLLKLIDMIDASSNSITMNKFIEYYNDLIDCVSYMVENGIDIPLVDTSGDEMIELDKVKLLSLGKMVK